MPEGGWNPGGIHDGGSESNVLPPSTRDYDNITPVTHNPSQSTGEYGLLADSVFSGEKSVRVYSTNGHDYNVKIELCLEPYKNKCFADTAKNKTELCITMVPDEKSGNRSDDAGMLGLVKDWINTVDFLKGKFICNKWVFRDKDLADPNMIFNSLQIICILLIK